MERLPDSVMDAIYEHLDGADIARFRAASRGNLQVDRTLMGTDGRLSARDRKVMVASAWHAVVQRALELVQCGFEIHAFSADSAIDFYFDGHETVEAIKLSLLSIFDPWVDAMHMKRGGWRHTLWPVLHPGLRLEESGQEYTVVIAWQHFRGLILFQ